MPNIKIFVDHDLLQTHGAALHAALPPLRDLACAQLSVPSSACQLAVIGVMGLEGQPQANLEYHYLATPERTPDRIREVSTAFRAFLAEVLGQPPAVRATTLDPATYVALK